MTSKGQTKSAASIPLKSAVKAKHISPSDVSSVGILLSKTEAIKLARNLLVIALSEEIKGDIVITGHPEPKNVTILGYKTWIRGEKPRSSKQKKFCLECSSL